MTDTSSWPFICAILGQLLSRFAKHRAASKGRRAKQLTRPTINRMSVVGSRTSIVSLLRGVAVCNALRVRKREREVDMAFATMWVLL